MRKYFVKKGEAAGLESRMKGIFLLKYFRILLYLLIIID